MGLEKPAMKIQISRHRTWSTYVGGKKNLAGFTVARQTKVSLGSEDIFVSRSKPGLPDFS
jgi:hypothetical protein